MLLYIFLLIVLSLLLCFAAERRSYYYPESILIPMYPAGAIWDKMEIQSTSLFYSVHFLLFANKSD